MNYKARLKDITTFIFDFDGVLTDGSVWVINDQDQVRATNTKDGYALHRAVKLGYRVAIISGGKGDSMRIRMNSVGVTDVFQASGHKIETFETYCRDHQIDPSQVLYMGDDIPDYEVMKRVGIAACPADACTEIKEIAHYISPVAGGRGCVRDVMEQVFKVHGHWMTDDGFTW